MDTSSHKNKTMLNLERNKEFNLKKKIEKDWFKDLKIDLKKKIEIKKLI